MVMHKVREWSRRYLPAELFGTVFAMLSAGLAFAFSGSGVVAAFAGTWGENLGYYGSVLVRDVSSSRKQHMAAGRAYGLFSFMRNIRNLVLEFGFSEVLDSFFIRPFFMYIFPLLLNNLAFGILLGKLAADVTFYIPTIISYEFRKGRFRD